mmetsp:Transcript_3246/g.8042  ORF Transcript_3246/g.8042 Transcript_3246/m.8042 type:complete len:214 (-) Transcript_3246:557-1198(-)
MICSRRSPSSGSHASWVAKCRMRCRLRCASSAAISSSSGSPSSSPTSSTAASSDNSPSSGSSSNRPLSSSSDSAVSSTALFPFLLPALRFLLPSAPSAPSALSTDFLRFPLPPLRLLAAISPLSIACTRRCIRCCLLWLELYRFLIALSVRPGSRFTISDQRVPSSATPSAIRRSSSSVHSPFFTAGHRWLNHRSRHCLPTRPVMCDAMRDQR